MITWEVAELRAPKPYSQEFYYIVRALKDPAGPDTEDNWITKGDPFLTLKEAQEYADSLNAWNTPAEEPESFGLKYDTVLAYDSASDLVDYIAELVNTGGMFSA